MRTLVIGAGIAGLTLAGRLCQQGRPPVIVERAASSDVGYAIGLYPLGSYVLHGLGTYGQLAERAVAVGRYELASGLLHDGRPAPGRDCVLDQPARRRG